jgi:dTDP-D-glucose 4,6-dehydratase
LAVFWLYPFSYIHGNGSNKRNYIFAEDVARAFDKIIHNGVVGTPHCMQFWAISFVGRQTW